ncbi:MAG: hypothetical protein ACXAD7_10555 [Candidatus Kariarchaeaceae archaeon]|jgi:YHS domain-containing protein
MNKTTLTACGSDVKKFEISEIFEGRKVYFCEEECLTEFIENPERFLKSDHFRITFPLLD